jgi:hypothetical protein
MGKLYLHLEKTDLAKNACQGKCSSLLYDSVKDIKNKIS